MLRPTGLPWLLLCVTALPAISLAGLPGEGEAVTSIHAAGVLDANARGGLGLGAEVRSALPLSDSAAVPDLELRAGAVHTRLPPKDVEAFMKANPEPADASVPDSLAFSRWEARLAASAAWGATSREPGPRLRAGLLGIVDGTAGAARRLEPIGWASDYTASLRLGPVASVGWAIPLGDAVDDPLIDVRLGGSWAVPASAGGGRLASEAERDFVLTVDDQTFGSAGIVGREVRTWLGADVLLDGLTVGAEVGLEHTARSAVARARARSESWDVQDVPEQIDPHVRVTVGWTF